MSAIPTYPKRLIEVDLPIKKISAHARREKSIRHGHISTLHVWWARRPLAACRAVICAALWPDPADPLCPEPFRVEAKKQMTQFWNQMDTTARSIDDPLTIRTALLDFIADFANWDNSTDERYLNTARALTQSAHEALGGKPGTRPLVVDPFAGGGSIPFEALRVGADAYASDLNPIAVLLNKVILEYVPKYGQALADEVKKWGQWVKAEAEKELAEYYPKDPDGATPIAYLWARTITCEGPGCGAEVPLIRSLWLAKKANRSVALQLIPLQVEKQVNFAIIQNAMPSDVKDGTVKRGSATCPCCGYTTPVASVRQQLKTRCGGADGARLFCVVIKKPFSNETEYRIPTANDIKIIDRVRLKIETLQKESSENYELLPNEPTPLGGGSGAGRAFSQRHYGIEKFQDLFTPRQQLMILTYSNIINNVSIAGNKDISRSLDLILALNLSKITSFSSSFCIWRNVRTCVAQTFGRPTLSIAWDFGEMNPFIGSAGDFEEGINYEVQLIEHITNSKINCGKSTQKDAKKLSTDNDLVDLFFTDPPYYDAVPYADLSDFFYVWLKRTIGEKYPELFSEYLVPKDEECIQDEIKGKTADYYTKSMAQAMSEGRRILRPNGIGAVVFAHKSTTGWEAQLNAMINAGWVITASWPIDTERPGRLRAHDSASLASSIHLVCRPRENPDGSIRTDDVGDWREVLQELPIRIHEWMPRLAAEGVVGADAIFACLGPALEIYSRYSRVEKPNGEQVLLREYLEKVWAAVAQEALKVIFHDADTSGFEEDARLTAMWLWTLSAGVEENGGKEEPEDDNEEKGTGKKKVTGFTLEYDAARKIAQGLGAHPEEMRTLVEVKGDTARLLPVSERAQYLFGKSGVKTPVVAKKRGKQMTLGESTGDDIEEAVAAAKSSMDGEIELVLGKTVLDSVHQSMLLFGAGRSDALKTFLVDNGAGRDQRFWKLAQALSALYPKSSEEKRWVDGVLARKKGLGL